MYETFFKRPFDIIFSMLAIVVLSPLCLLAGIFIVLNDGFPVLFRQTRVGRRQEPFRVLKFRTMTRDTPDVESAAAASLTITRVGSTLRRFSIDELPQLINILCGDMSVVGPRPALQSQEGLIELREAGGAYRVRPGLTGLAQITGYDGMPDVEKAKCDNGYAQNVTFLNDVSIILRTVAYLFRPPPVY